jgi:hypothetical protein
MRAWFAVVLSACSFSGAGGVGDGDGDAGIDADLRDCVCVDGQQSCVDEAPVSCALVCDDATGRCAPIAPSNNADGHSIDIGAVAPWVVANDLQIDTDDGSMAGATTRPAGTGVMAGIGYEQVDGAAVFVVASMTVDPGVVIQVVGSLPIIIRAAGDVEISGRFDLSAGLVDCGFEEQRACPGPGGGRGGDTDAIAGGCAPGGDGEGGGGNDGESGGGGGGGGVAGAKGGDASGSSDGGAAGVPGTLTCFAPTIQPLAGGSGGGRGGTEDDQDHAAGGGGGGAIQISSDAAIRVVGGADIAGILAGGEGGGAGGVEDGGGGGGGGGSILLEAPAIHLEDATLAANGGAGGGRDDGSPGEAGRFDDTPADGQDTAGDSGTSVPPQPGTNTTTDSGGGGGGGGRVRLNHAGFTTGGAVIRSPAETTGDVTPALSQ